MEDNNSDMTQEDQIKNCGKSYSIVEDDTGSKCGRPCKKQKLKIPKRGSGIAQLEKRRIEQQQKKDKAVTFSANIPSSRKSSYLASSIPNIHYYNQVDQPCFSSFSFPSGSLQNVNDKVSNTVTVPGYGIVPKPWRSHENDLKKKSFVAQPGLACQSSLPNEYNFKPIRPLSKWVPTTQPHQQAYPISMVNQGVSSTPSLRYSMEPSSNQNYSGYWMPLQKVRGMKRPYPFPQNGPASFNYAANATFSEVPSSSTSNLEANSKKSNTVNEHFSGNGSFLIMASPTPTSLCPPSKPMSPSTTLAFHNQEYPHKDSLSHQGIIEDQSTLLPVFSRFNQLQQPFYVFLPPVAKEAQVGQTSARIQNDSFQKDSSLYFM